MNVSTDEGLKGDFLVEAHAKEDMSDEYLRRLDVLLDSFIGSVSSGMYQSAELLGNVDMITVREGKDSRRRYRGRRFIARGLSRGVFRILSGMFAYFSEMFAPLERYVACLNDSSTNLLELKADYPLVVDKLGFRVMKGELVGVAPELLIRVEFMQAVPQGVRDDLIQPFEYWDELMCGGFPPEGESPGDSGVGPGSTRFIDAYTVEHYLESFCGDPVCFNLIINLASHWSKRFPVRQVEIE